MVNDNLEMRLEFRLGCLPRELTALVHIRLHAFLYKSKYVNRLPISPPRGS